MVFPTKLSSVFYWSNSFLGHFHIETNAYRALKNIARSVLAREKFNFIIVSSPPVNIIRLGKYLKKKFNVPLIADFRDSYDNQLLNPNYIPPVKKKIEFFLFRKSLKRWLAHADIICSVSDAVLQTLPIYSSGKKIIVMNGYEEDNRQLKDRQKNESMFIISIVGSLYPQQDIDFMVKGLYHFIKKTSPEKLLVRFVGLKSRLTIRSKIEKEIDEKYLQFTNRVSRDEALQFMHSSSILLQVGWRGYKGFCPGKVFEYLATGKNILVAPGDGDLTDKIIAETNAGRSVTTIEEMSDYLSEQYQEWLRCGRLSYHGIPGKLEKYSRKNQNMILVDTLDNYPDSISTAS